MAGIRVLNRRFRGAPGLVFAAVTVGALATSLNASVVSVVDRIVLRPLPFLEPDQLIQVSSRSQADSRSDARLSLLYSSAIRERAKSISSSSFALGSSTTLRIANGAAATFYSATHNLLPTLGVRVAAGRDFVEPDAASPGRHVLISRELWLNQFGGAHDVFARSWESETVGDMFGRRFSEPLWVVGVLPPDFVPPSSEITEQLDGLILTREYRAPATNPTMTSPALIARLRPGQTLDAAASEIKAVAQAAWIQRTDLHESGVPPDLLVIEPLRSGLFYKLTGFARLTLLAAALLVALSAVNLAILLVVHHRRHEREAAIQSALGPKVNTSWRAALLVIQMAVTTTLIGGAVVAGRNYLAAATAQGFDAEGLATLSAQYLVGLPPAQRIPQIVHAVAGLREVAAVGVSVPSILGPFLHGESETFWKDRGVAGGIWGITDRLFEATATPMRAGRGFSEDEVAGRAPVALLNETGARVLFPAEKVRNIVGREIDTRQGRRVVVGVVQDIKPIGRTDAIAGH